MLQIAQNTDECSVEIKETLESTMVTYFVFNPISMMVSLIIHRKYLERSPISIHQT